MTDSIRGNRINRIIKDSRGFTLLETLLAVAIVAVLLGLSIMGVIAVQKELRQRELDSKAEIIYMAAQNRLTELTASGRAELYTPDNSKTDIYSLGLIPCDSDPEKRTEDSLFYVKSDTVGTGEISTAAVILPESRVEKELRDNNWVIEYDPSGGSVYAVFYSEEDMTYEAEDFDNLRVKKVRKMRGAKIGYYGGDTAAVIDTDTLTPRIEIYNEETLHAILVCNRTAYGNVHFNVEIKDSFGNSVKEYIQSEKLIRVGNNLTCELMLDKLKTGERFNEKYPELVAGSDITVTLTAGSDSDLVDIGTTASTPVNSLFDAVSGDDKDTAEIKYCRHLQNLDSGSGAGAAVGSDAINITEAVQKNSLHFENDAENTENWYSIYGADAYKAVANDSLASYTASYTDETGKICNTVIYGLDTKTGLFDVFKGTLIKDVILSGTKISGGTYAGALAGRVIGTTAITGCRVYLSETEGDLKNKTEKDIWISGSTYTGGLVGYTEGNVTITGSFAATVAGTKTSDYTGGLVGYAKGSLSTDESYADCYLYGESAGGLVGGADNTCNISINNCYSAGYITAENKAAGFVPEKAEAISNSYSACAYMKNSQDEYADNIYATAKDKTTLSNVYYMQTGGISDGKSVGTVVSYTIMSDRAEFVKNLGDKFTAETGGDNTVAYNLMNQGLTDYSFPRLDSLQHCGDWEASFESGEPVYYEIYSNETYGIYGANLDTLKKSGSAAGDGYGIIYDHEPNVDVMLEYNSEVSEVNATLNHSEAVKISDDYWLLKFPADAVNTANAPADFYQEIKIDSASYYYNPHFAKTVTSSKPKTAAKAIYVRTARHLYNMSLYYSNYATDTKDSTYTQELDIYYGTYRWSGYAGIGSAIKQQAPIGKGVNYRFDSAYDGGSNVIDGVSFVSGETGYYAGMFGYNSGVLKNIAVVSEYSGSDSCSVSLHSTTNVEGSGAEAYIGVLTGFNAKTIRNCAVSGYTINAAAYRSSKLCAGGLAGCNGGSVRGSSAECPVMDISETYATVDAGGFTGKNTGNVSDCYAIGILNVSEAKQGNAVIAGFTGENKGIISGAYCMTAITISGSATGYGFAPAGGSVSNCRYVNGGAYYYIGRLNSYNIAAGDTRATAVRASQLKALAENNNTKAVNSLYHGRTDETDYPYPATVKKGSEYIHYGNWPVGTELGDAGMFYWEHEEGGSNAGYHFSYIGKTDSLTVSGSSLCTAHSDGGIITDYGYGYYYRTDTVSDVGLTMTDFGGSPEPDEDAGNAIAGQISGYTVVAYKTGKENGGLYLDGNKYSSWGERFNNYNKTANGTWNLSYKKNGNTDTCQYTVCPFFADSFSYGSTPAPGTDDKKYEIRSTKQLQYINWNCRTLDAAASVTGTDNDSNDSFTYLKYAGYRNLTGVVKSSNFDDGLNYYWSQTHDVDNSSKQFTPIGSMFYTSDDNNGNAYIACFGGFYNGNAYSIKNIQIQSNAQMVGLFGITIGAELKNIVMYSESDNEISVGNVKNAKTYKWYCVGGLVGFAAEGNVDDGGVSSAVFENCTVSGYRIIDKRTENGGWGGGSVGGLAGATNMDISKCTAVNDIIINADYASYGSNGWKNIRVGGLVGNCRSTIDGCYAGGSIASNVRTIGSTVAESENVWIGGINGGIVMINYGNLKNIVGSTEDVVYVKNSYSYVTLPGTGANQIRCSQSIASIGEMQAGFDAINNPYLFVQNCYAYTETAKNTDDYAKAKDNANYWSGIKSNNNKQRYCIAYYKDNYNNERYISLNNGGKSPYVTYEQLSADISEQENSVAYLLNNNGDMPKAVQFGFVTTAENGAGIDGRYSYPGNDESLEGTNYPFPTVLTQNNALGNTVNVHYGTWPKGALYWQNSMKSFDMLENSTVEMNLLYGGTDGADIVPSFTFLDEEENNLTDSPLSVVSSNFVTADKYYKVVFRALKEGTVTVRAKIGSTTADTLVSVTADLLIAADPAEIVVTPDSTGELRFTVTSAKGTGDFTGQAGWDIEVDDESIASVIQKSISDDGKYVIRVEGLKSGETSITATATYKVNIDGKEQTFKEDMVVLVEVR